jgi:hypothetical protein
MCGSAVLRLVYRAAPFLVALALGGCSHSIATNPTSTPSTTAPVPNASPVPTLKRASPNALNLTVQDVPRGFQQTTAEVLSDAQVASLDNISLSTLKAVGRITSYHVLFQRRAHSGLIDIDATVSSYTSPQGAHQDYQRIVQGAQAQGYFHPLQASAIGDEYTALTSRALKGGSLMTSDVVLFRRGPYTASLIVDGVPGTFTTGQVYSLAQTIDTRLKSAS